jgi:hypothetical protein
MIRSIIVAAAVAAGVPALAQTAATDASSMTCAEYMELQASDRPGILESLFGRGEAEESAGEETLEATADVSADELAAACEANDEMTIAEAAEQARSD